MLTDWILYPLRRLGQWVVSGEPSCEARLCATHNVGFSVWCRYHQDQLSRVRHLRMESGVLGATYDYEPPV